MGVGHMWVWGAYVGGGHMGVGYMWVWGAHVGGGHMGVGHMLVWGAHGCGGTQVWVTQVWGHTGVGAHSCGGMWVQRAQGHQEHMGAGRGHTDLSYVGIHGHGMAGTRVWGRGSHRRTRRHTAQDPRESLCLCVERQTSLYPQASVFFISWWAICHVSTCGFVWDLTRDDATVCEASAPVHSAHARLALSPRSGAHE